VPGTTAVIVGVDPGLYMDYWTVNASSTIDADFEYCQGLWEFTVAHVWLAANEPSESERQRWLEAAWDCARELGMTLSEPPSRENATDAVAMGCGPWQ